MSKVQYILIVMFATLTLVIAPAQAQDTNESMPDSPIPIELDGESGSLHIKHELTTTGEAELTIGDQIYKLNIPVKVQIDTSQFLADASLTVQSTSTVGSIMVEPVGLAVLNGAYEKGYTTVAPSGEDNAIVIFTAILTNLHDETLDLRYSSELEAFAIDTNGKSYSEEERVCSEVQPSEAVTCDFIFDAPNNAELVDLKIETVAHKQFSFSTLDSIN